MNPVRSSVILAIAIGVGPALSAVEPEQSQKFRAEVNYVELSMIARDKDQKAVTDLSSSDIELFEDGRPQKLSTFFLQSVAIATPDDTTSARADRPDGELATAETRADRRAYMLVADVLHTSFEQRGRLSAALKLFITKYLAPTDMAALILLGNSPRASVFTSDSTALLSTLAGMITPGRPTDVTVDLGGAEMNDAVANAGAVFEAIAAEQSLHQLTATVRALGGLTGRRKTLVFFSEGIGTNLFPSAAPQSREAAGRVLSAQKSFLAVANAFDVNVYPIDVRGLSAIDPFATGDTAVGRQWDSLRRLADETGGRSLIGRVKMEKPFSEIVQDASHYYVVGYHSPAPSDGKSHRIEIRCRRKGVTIRSRTQYFSTPPGPRPLTDPVRFARDLLNAALPVDDGGIAITAKAAKIEDLPNGGGVVEVRVDVSRTASQIGAAGRLKDVKLQIGLAAYDASGTQLVERLAMAPFDGRHLVTSVQLPAGYAQIRVVVIDTANERAGSVFLDVNLAATLGDAGQERVNK